MKILICDDRQDGYESAKQRIPPGHSVKGLFGKHLQDALRGLFSSISVLLQGADSCSQRHSEFNGYDVAIVDNDLSGLDVNGVRLSAEAIIGYLRAFTDTPYLVSLNKNPTVDFDLRYLFGDYQSQADLAVNTDHLGNARLWTREPPSDGFAPWYWPCLPDAADRRRRQIDLVGARSGQSSIWQTLQFPPIAREYLSQRAKARLVSRMEGEALATDSCAVDETTFRGFFAGTKALLPDDARRLYRMADRAASAETAVNRVVAGDLDRWLRRDVLGPQDVLIDKAHLLVRMPFLFDGVQDVQSWNAALRRDEPPYGIKADVYEAHVQPALFAAKEWQASTCFWWPVLRQDHVLNQMFFDSDPWPDAVFCEDTSSFVEFTEDDGGVEPREFEAEIEGSWPRRFVVDVDRKQYSPRSRLVG